MSAMEWWYIPALLTVVGLAASGWLSKNAKSVIAVVVCTFLLMFGAIVILITWLVGALLR